MSKFQTDRPRGKKVIDEKAGFGGCFLGKFRLKSGITFRKKIVIDAILFAKVRQKCRL